MPRISYEVLKTVCRRRASCMGEEELSRVSCLVMVLY